MASQKTKKKKTRLRYIFLILVTLILIGITTAAMCGVVLAVYIDRYINSDLDLDLDDVSLNLTTFLYYRDDETGELVQYDELYSSENRIWVNLDEIPKHLQNAFIAVEDQRFRTHKGVDWKRTIGATLDWVGLYDVTGGGSTITQQLIKNITDDDEVTVQRKIREIFRALEVERNYTKDQILELYLNTIFLGQNCNGVQTAAQTYFGKDVSELSLAECASIAGITKYPYKYDPFRHEDYNKERQELILRLMREQGMISKEEEEAAKAESLAFKKDKQEENKKSIQTYFTDQVIRDVLNDLVEQKGYSEKLARTLLYNGGLCIETTINPKIQQVMDDVFTDEANFPNVRGTDGTLPEAAMIIIDPHTGNVVAMYGGRGQKQGALTLNRAVQSKRSPGSAIKPITVYAPALEYGYITPASAMDDVPINFSYKQTGWPNNYYTNKANPNGSGYKGRMSIVQAVEISNNTIPAQIITKMTPGKAFTFATTNLGVTSLVQSRTTSSGRVVSDIDGPAALALGGLTDGISVLELTAAYVPFATDGTYIEPRTYVRVSDSSGAVILENDPETHQAMTQKTAASMRNLLEVVVYGKVGGATGAKAKITGIRTAGKTGTTTDDKDRWFVGFTPYYVASVWFGYDRQQEVKVSGNPALNLWEKVMQQVHADLPNLDFTEPEDFGTYSFCRDSGCLATEWCKADPRGSRVISMTMSKEDRPTTYCTLHQPVKIDASTGMAATEYCPEESIKTVGLLDVSRSFPIGDIYIDDQPYTLPVAVAEGSTAPADYHCYCTVHTAQSQNPLPPEDPSSDPEDPSSPGSEEGAGSEETPSSQSPQNPEETGAPPSKPDKPSSGEEGGSAVLLN